MELWDLDPVRLARKVESPFGERRFFPACNGGTPGSTYTSKIPCWELSDDRRTLAAAFTPEDPANAFTQHMVIDTATLAIERLEMPEGTEGYSFTSFAFSPDNRWLAVGNSEQLWLYDRAARDWARAIAGEEHRSNALAPMRFTADSKRLVALGDQLQLNVFDVDTGARIGRHNPGYAVSLDGRSVAVSHRRGVAVWDTATDQIRFPLRDPKRKPLPYPMQRFSRAKKKRPSRKASGVSVR